MTTAHKKETGGMENRPKIMTKPLPEILDDLDNYIKRLEEADAITQNAVREAREAAAQAKESGERAAEAARKAAEAAVSKVREEAAKAIDTINKRISTFEADVNIFKDKVNREAMILDQAFVASREKHLKESPFFEK